jgi:hypothetical protein
LPRGGEIRLPRPEKIMTMPVAVPAKAGPTPSVSLPSFDPYMLGHRDKEHLVDEANYKRVYRKAGWLSPVVLFAGRVMGVWSHERRGKCLHVNVEPFAKRRCLLKSLSAMGIVMSWATLSAQEKALLRKRPLVRVC